MHLPNEDSFNVDLGSVFTTPTVKSAVKLQESTSTLCPSCLKNGKKSILADYQINFEEAIRLCPESTCPYPLKEDNVVESFVFKRDASVLPLAKETNVRASGRKSRKSSGYSTFFEDFDLDSLLDFSTPSFQNQSMQNVDDEEKDTNKAEANFTSSAVEELNNHEHLINEECNSNDSSENPEADILAENPAFSTIEASSLDNPESPESLFDENGTAVSDNEIPMEVEIETENLTEQNLENNLVESINRSNRQKDDRSDANVTENEDTIGIIEKLSRPPIHNVLLQWVNEENSCWLDAILQVLVSSVNTRASLNLSKPAEKSVLKKVIMNYDVCQQANQIYLTSNTNNDDTVIMSLCEKLSNVRKELLELLKQITSFQQGDFQSLLEMLPLVLTTCQATADLFRVNMIWDFQCEKCGHRRARRSHDYMLSFPKVCSDFHPLNAQFQRRCFECKSPSGVTSILMERLPACLAFHFQEGLPHSNLRVLDFAIQGQLYCVFAVVRYVLTPFKHFITWIRDVKTNKWLCCDDLKSPLCKWQSRQPRIPAREIHMVFWERQSVSDPSSADESQLSTLVNEETVAIADEIPVEVFFAHEDDETIVVPEQDDPDTSMIPPDHHQNDNALQPSNSPAETTVVDQMPYSMHQQHSEVSFTPGAEPQAICPHPTNNSFMFQPQMFVNGGVSVVPSQNQQMIQVVAPANTCSIYIVTNDCRNKQLLYQGTPGPGQSHDAARPSVTSFVNDSHRYGRAPKMFSSGKHRDKLKFSAYPQKRQYRLAGYSSYCDKNKFSPLRPSVSKTPQLTKEYLSKTYTESQEKEKPDSEKLSEISELSDLLPEFDLDSNHSMDSYSSAPAALRCSAATPPLSLIDGNLTPTNSLFGIND